MRQVLTLLLLASLLLSGASRAEIVVVASNRSGPIELTREQAEKLYLGRSVTLGDGTPISQIGRAHV